jgi:hypothetical protein
MNMNGTEEESGLCEGEGERVGHFGESISWLIVGSGDYMRLYAVPSGRVSRGRKVGSDLIGLFGGLAMRSKGRVAVSGALTDCPLFLGLVLRLCSLARPQDSSGSDSFVHPSPPLPLLSFLLPLSNYLLVSSPAGRSFFEKTTRAY